jgi:hypothetical protein
MNQLTQPTEDKPTQPDANQKGRPVPAAVLLNAVPTLSALVLVAASIGPKIPPYLGE